MRLMISVIVVSVVTLLSQVNVNAETIRCGSHVFPPFIIDNGGSYSGIYIDLIDEIHRRTDMRINVQFLPWSRVLK